MLIPVFSWLGRPCPRYVRERCKLNRVAVGHTGLIRRAVSVSPLYQSDARSIGCGARTQGTPLPSADGAAVLILGSDGDLVLYNTLARQLYGNSYASTIFASGTSGKGTAPYHLIMQGVRCPSCCALLPAWRSACPSAPLAWLLWA